MKTLCSILFLGSRTLVKSAYQKINFLISQPNHMLRVLKRTVSMRNKNIYPEIPCANQENYQFPRFHSGSNIFQGGGGSKCLFPIETHITCDFQGRGRGTRPPVPPLDPCMNSLINSFFVFRAIMVIQGP